MITSVSGQFIYRTALYQVSNIHFLDEQPFDKIRKQTPQNFHKSPPRILPPRHDLDTIRAVITGHFLTETGHGSVEGGSIRFHPPRRCKSDFCTHARAPPGTASQEVRRGRPPTPRPGDQSPFVVRRRDLQPFRVWFVLWLLLSSVVTYLSFGHCPFAARPLPPFVYLLKILSGGRRYMSDFFRRPCSRGIRFLSFGEFSRSGTSLPLPGCNAPRPSSNRYGVRVVRTSCSIPLYTVCRCDIATFSLLRPRCLLRRCRRGTASCQQRLPHVTCDTLRGKTLASQVHTLP